jgi:hypothetical protein
MGKQGKTKDKLMKKNKIQFQKGLSLPEFLNECGAEDQCFKALVNLRWPDGFILPRYLATFQYCFNRRFVLEDIIKRLAFVSLRTLPMPSRPLKLAEYCW